MIALILLLVGSIAALGQALSTVTLGSMQEFLAIAIKNRSDLKAASLKVESAQQALWRTNNQKLPTLQFNADNRFNTQLQSNLLPGLIFGQPGQDRLVAFGATFSHVYGLEAGFSIFRPQQKFEAVAGLIAVKQAEKQLEILKNQVLTEVADAVLSLQSAWIDFEIRNKQLDLALSEKDDSENLWKEGKIKSIELQKNKLNVLRKENDKREAERQIKVAASRLHVALGLEPNDLVYLLEQKALELTPPALSVQVSSNLSLQLSDLVVNFQKQQEQIQRRRYLPQVSGYGWLASQYLSQNFDVFSFSNPWSPFSYLGIKLNWVIFDKLDRKNAIKQAQLATQIAEFDKARLFQQKQLDIQEAKEAFESKQQALLIAQEALRLAQSILEIEQKSFEEGKILRNELNAIKLDCLIENANWKKANIEFWRSWYQWKSLIGTSN